VQPALLAITQVDLGDMRPFVRVHGLSLRWPQGNGQGRFAPGPWAKGPAVMGPLALTAAGQLGEL
jgi:hypothetical protein